MKKKYDLIIIGAGASGLTAAATAGQSGRSVLLIEHNSQPARKVFVSGAGKCNFSNKFVSSKHYFSKNPHFCKSALAGFSYQDLIHHLDKACIPWQEREEGKLFAFSSGAIRSFLVERAKKANVDILLEIPFFTLEKKSEIFSLNCCAGNFFSKNVLIASGGISYPALGATDIGYRLAKQFGLDVIQPEPALVSLNWGGHIPVDFSGLSGVSVFVHIKTGKICKQGMLLFTPQGISGPVVLQLSLYWQAGQMIEIDFLPQTDLFSILKKHRQAKEKKRLQSILSDYLPLRLARCFVSVLDSKDKDIPLSAMSDKSFNQMDKMIKHFRFIPEKTGGWSKAEVTKGGVDVDCLSSSTMESRKVSGLYFSGEVLDITGELGGFNLHWAFASGFAVGKAVCNKYK